MATRAYQPEPLDVLLAAIPSLPRPLLSRLTARMIERLDEIDGDPDVEETDAEDSFQLSWRARDGEGPGCPCSDPGHDEPDEDDDPEEENGDAESGWHCHDSDDQRRIWTGFGRWGEPL